MSTIIDTLVLIQVMPIPTSFKKYFYLGIVFLFFGASSNAQMSLIDSLESFVKIFDRNSDSDGQKLDRLYNRSLLQGDQLQKQKKYYEAIDIYHRCFKIYPTNYGTLVASASCYAMQGNADSAIADLELAYKSSKVGATWNDLKSFETDHDFDQIRNDPHWKKYIDSIRSTIKTKDDNYQWGILFGVMTVLMFYNFFLFISIKDRSYLYYAILILVQIHFECIRSAPFGDFVFQHITEFGYISWIKYPFPFAVSLMTVSYIVFFISFLKLKELDPRSFKILRIAIVIFASHSLISIFYGTHALGKAFEIFTFAAYIYLFNITFNCWIRKKYKPARFLVLAAFLLTASVVLLLLERFGIDVYFRVGVLRPDNIGVLCFMTLLSFALGDRINILAQEKAEAQEKALEVLEQKVQERTKEVVEKSKIIEEKNDDIMASITYARRIQRAHLPTEKYLNKIFERFKK